MVVWLWWVACTPPASDGDPTTVRLPDGTVTVPDTTTSPTPGPVDTTPEFPVPDQFDPEPIASVPVYGGTMEEIPDLGSYVAADPPNNRLLVRVDDETFQGFEILDLGENARPFRILVEGDRAYVTLRGTGELVAANVRSPVSLTWRTQICREPRGVTRSPAGPLVVVCAEGLLVEVNDDGVVTRSAFVVEDLRDALPVGDLLYVSRFTSAEIVGVDASTLGEVFRVPIADDARQAWRIRPDPDEGGIYVLHQRVTTKPLRLDKFGLEDTHVYDTFTLPTVCGTPTVTTLSRVPEDSRRRPARARSHSDCRGRHRRKRRDGFRRDLRWRRWSGLQLGLHRSLARREPCAGAPRPRGVCARRVGVVRDRRQGFGGRPGRRRKLGPSIRLADGTVGHGGARRRPVRERTERDGRFWCSCFTASREGRPWPARVAIQRGSKTATCGCSRRPPRVRSSHPRDARCRSPVRSCPGCPTNGRRILADPTALMHETWDVRMDNKELDEDTVTRLFDWIEGLRPVRAHGVDSAVEIDLGLAAFTKAGCGACHAGPAFTQPGRHERSKWCGARETAEPARSRRPAPVVPRWVRRDAGRRVPAPVRRRPRSARQRVDPRRDGENVARRLSAHLVTITSGTRAWSIRARDVPEPARREHGGTRGGAHRAGASAAGGRRVRRPQAVSDPRPRPRRSVPAARRDGTRHLRAGPGRRCAGPSPPRLRDRDLPPRGAMQHEDSAGHRGSLQSGDVQWMTAGAGIIHSEEPAPELLRARRPRPRVPDLGEPPRHG